MQIIIENVSEKNHRFRIEYPDSGQDDYLSLTSNPNWKKVNNLLKTLCDFAYEVDSSADGNDVQSQTERIKHISREITKLIFDSQWDHIGTKIATNYQHANVSIRMPKIDSNRNENPWFPWEMLCLNDHADLKDMLGFGRLITREFPYNATSFERTPEENKIVAFLGASKNKNDFINAEREAIIKGNTLSIMDMPEIDVIVDDCPIIHISGMMTHVRHHDESYIMASREKWIDRHFLGTKKLRSPLIVFNIRDNYVRDPNHVLDFIKYFMGKKARFVVASEYPVPAVTAHAFASEFYNCYEGEDMSDSEAIYEAKSRSNFIDNHPFAIFYAAYAFNRIDNSSQTETKDAQYESRRVVSKDYIADVIVPKNYPSSWLYIYQQSALIDRDNPSIPFTISIENESRNRQKIHVALEFGNQQNPTTKEIELQGREEKNIAIMPYIVETLPKTKTELRTLSVSIKSDWEKESQKREIKIALDPLHNFCWKYKDEESNQSQYFHHHIVAWINTSHVEDYINNIVDMPKIGYPSLALNYDVSYRAVLEQIKYIFNSLQDFNIIDGEILNTLSNPMQHVNLPKRTLEKRSMNCLDGAVLYASFLKRMNLRPLIVFKRGHAFVGWHRAKVLTERQRGNLSSNQKMFIEGYDFLETTLTGKETFETAMGVANDQYEELLNADAFNLSPDQSNYAVMVDINSYVDYPSLE